MPTPRGSTSAGGGGGGGLTSVAHDGTLTGLGTVMSPLGVVAGAFGIILALGSPFTGDGSTATPLDVVAASGAARGTMSAADFTKLAGVAANAAALTAAAPADVTKAAAVVGVATLAARADHKHDISTAAASGLNASSTNTEGSATSLARSDHTHAITGFVDTSSAQNSIGGAKTWTAAATFSSTALFSGVVTFNAIPIVSITDATTNAATDVVTLTHLTSGTAAANIGTGILFRSQDGAGNTEDLGWIRASFSTVTNGSEASYLSLGTRNAGGAASEQVRVNHLGTAFFGSFAVTPVSTIKLALPNATSLAFLRAANDAYINAVTADSSNNLIIGSTTSWVLALQSSGIISFTASGAQRGSITSTLVYFGSGEGTGTVGAYTWRGANAAGTNITAGDLTLDAPRSTGTGTSASWVFRAGLPQASGTTAHVMQTVFTAAYNLFTHSQPTLFNADVRFDNTDSTASPGAATINKPQGRSAVASGASTVVITNSLVTAASRIWTQYRGVVATGLVDATALAITLVTSTAGSFTVTVTANVTAASGLAFDWGIYN